MNVKITLDLLNVEGVSVKTQMYTIIDDTEYPVGQPHRKAYENSDLGRQEIVEELPEAYANAIFAVWGDEPTEFGEEINGSEEIAE